MTPSSPAPDASGLTVVALRSRGPSEVTAAAVDLEDLNSPHTLAVLSVPPGASVLDVGCGPGIVARALAARGCRVTGIEVDPRKAAVARPSCVEVVEADLETIALSSLFGNRTFDVVMCLDVLEHLREPAAVLTALTSVLAPGGRVLISVPNVTHGALRLELLKGRFAYRSSGLLDRGHLRFFDADGLTDLIQRSGLQPETTLRVIKRLDQTEFDVDLEALPIALREALEKDPDALTYQFFVVARPVRDGEARPDASSLPERLRARIDLLAAELEKAGGYARSLESELQAKDELIQSQTAQAGHVAAVTAELDRAAVYARHLEAEIANRDQQIRDLEIRSGADGAALAAEQAARQRADESAARTLGLEELVADLRRLLDDQVAYGRYLEGELQRRTGEVTVRDDELHVLRAHIQKTEQAIADRDARLHAAAVSEAELRDQLDQRLHQLTQHEQHLRALLGDLATARQLVADRDGELGAAARTSAGLAEALADERRRIVELCELVRQHQIRLAARAADGFVQHAPGVYRLLRPVVMAGLARWRPDENPR